MTADTNVVTCASHIADHDLSNHIFNAFVTSVLFFNSSFERSKIRIFASIASQTDNISQAIDARVNTTPLSFTRARVRAIYMNSATQASIQENL